MKNKQLLDLAKRPLMAELILEALPDIKKGKAIDLARIYLYAVKQKMERDIKNERTFTSLADKLYFLCELSWEMLSTDKMALNYRLFPDRIRQLFGPVVQEQKDLDHWYYDMMGQTMLIPNADGDYAPAHRSLLEFFVAYKLVAELGVLASDFTEIACIQSHIDIAVLPHDYTWSSYFHRDVGEDGKIKLIPPLNTFVAESLNNLSKTLGKQPITKAVLDFMNNMLLPDKKELKKRLLLSIKGTAGKTVEGIGITAGNIATLITYYDPKALRGVNLSGNNLYKADFGIRTRGRFHFEAKPVDLSNANLEGANLKDVDFSDVILVNTNFSRCSLYGSKGIPSVGDHFFDKIALAPDGSFLVAGGIEGIVKLWWLETGKEQVITEKMSWIGCLAISSDKKLVAAGDNMGRIIIYDIQKSQIMHQIRDHKDCVASLVFDPDKNCLIVASGGNPPRDNSLRIYTISDGNLNWHYRHNASFNELVYYPPSSILLTLDWEGSIDLWDIEKKLHIRNLINRVNDEQNQISEKRVSHFSISADCQQMLVVRDSGREFALQILEVPELGTIWKREKFPLYVAPPESPLPRYLVPPGMDHSFMLSNQAHLIAFSVDNVLVLWNVLEDREIWHSNEHLHWIENIVFSQDDKYIVTSCRDDTIKLWDVENGKTVKTISTSRNYSGLKLTGSSGLDSEALRALGERGAII
jgi:WD40 repeat protein